MSAVKLCKRGHPRTPENLSPSGRCRLCRRLRERREHHRRQAADPAYRERKREAARAWRERHPERLRANNRAYYERNHERLRERSMERYYSDDPAVHLSIQAARVRADIKRREQRIAKRREARVNGAI